MTIYNLSHLSVFGRLIATIGRENLVQWNFHYPNTNVSVQSNSVEAHGQSFQCYTSNFGWSKYSESKCSNRTVTSAVWSYCTNNQVYTHQIMLISFRTFTYCPHQSETSWKTEKQRICIQLNLGHSGTYIPLHVCILEMSVTKKCILKYTAVSD